MFEICMVDQLFRSFPGLEAVIQATGIKVFNGTAMHKTGIQIVSPGGSVDTNCIVGHTSASSASSANS